MKKEMEWKSYEKTSKKEVWKIGVGTDGRRALEELLILKIGE